MADFAHRARKLVRLVAEAQGVTNAEARQIIASWVSADAGRRPSPAELHERRARQRSAVNIEVLRRRAGWLARNMNEYLAAEGLGLAWRAPVAWRRDRVAA